MEKLWLMDINPYKLVFEFSVDASGNYFTAVYRAVVKRLTKKVKAALLTAAKNLNFNATGRRVMTRKRTPPRSAQRDKLNESSSGESRQQRSKKMSK